MLEGEDEGVVDALLVSLLLAGSMRYYSLREARATQNALEYT